jgi:membrane-associated protease RseP (regulator of RpoE activity)
MSSGRDEGARVPSAEIHRNVAERASRELIFLLCIAAAESVWEAFRKDAQVPGYLWAKPGDLVKVLLDLHVAQWFPVVVALPAALVVLAFRRSSARERPSVRTVFVLLASGGAALIAAVALLGGPGTVATRYVPLVTLGIVGAAVRTTNGVSAGKRQAPDDPSGAPGKAGAGAVGCAVGRVAVIAFALLALLIGGFLRSVATVEHSAKATGFAGVGVGQTIGSDGSDHPLVKSVLPLGPAGHSGLRDGDVILAVSGMPVATPTDVTRAVSAYRPGTRVDFLVLRGTDQVDFTVVLIDRFDGLRLEGAVG